jgi:hypothetical protein
MSKGMGRVTCELSMSVDGYSAGLNQTEQRPFGDDGGDGWGDKLLAWMADTPDENPAEIDQMAAARAAARSRSPAAQAEAGRASAIARGSGTLFFVTYGQPSASAVPKVM